MTLNPDYPTTTTNLHHLPAHFSNKYPHNFSCHALWNALPEVIYKATKINLQPPI